MKDLFKLGKKVFTLSVVVMTILWSVGVAALVPLVVVAADCPELEAGDLFKVPDNTAVYLLNADLERMYFPSSEIYHSWYEDFSGVVTIDNTCVDAYPAPSKAPYGVNYRPGSKLVKVQISPSVYVVEPGNQKSKIASEAVAKALYGNNWAKLVRDVADVYWPNYAANGAEITEAVPHNGMLVKTSAGDTTYQVVGGMLYEVDGSLASYVAGDVRTVAQSVLDELEVADTTKTAAGVLENPSQIEASAAEEAAEEEEEAVTTAAGNLTVSLAVDTPASGYALAGASRAPFTKVVFQAGDADVTIDTFKVKRTGSPGTDTDFSTVNVLTPEGNFLNDAGKTLNSDHEVTFTENITIPANTSKTYTLVGNMAALVSMTAGNVPKLSLTSVTLVGTGTVTGLPVEGNAMTTNESLTLASATFAEGTVVGSITKQVGATNILLASLKLTNGTSGSDAKKIQLEKLTLYNNGTLADADITSFKLKYNNATIGSAALVNKYLTFDLSACGDDCILDKGYDRTYDIYADLTGGSGRTIDFYIYTATHAVVKDVTNGVYITPTVSAVDASADMTNTVTISQAKVNVTKVNNVPAGNIPKNATNIELGSWNFNVTGEPVDFRQVVFKITPTATGKAEMLDSMILYNAAGTALIGGVDGVGASAATVGGATSTDTFTLQAGDNILTLKGTIDNNPAAGDTFTVSIEMSNSSNIDWRGVNSGLAITHSTYATPASAVGANIRTIQTSALTVTTLSTPAAKTYAPGTNDVVFSKVSLDASASTEDIKISQFIATDVCTSGKTIDLQNIRLWVDKDGDSYNSSGSAVALTEVVAGSDSTAGNDENFTWNLSGDDQFIVKAGKKVVVEIKANIAGGATAGTHQVNVDTANDVTGTGQTTKNQVTEVISSATANNVTVGTAGGTVEVSLASDSKTAQLYAGGTTVELASFKFYATSTEDVELDYLYLTQVVTVTASSSYKDYDEIWFENESGVEVAGTRMSPTSTKPYVDFTENAFVVDTDHTGGDILYLKAKLAAIGTGFNGTSANKLGYKINAQADVVAKGDLSGTGSTEYLSSSSAPTGYTHYAFKAYPVFKRVTVDDTKLTNGTRDLFKFTITAVNGDIALDAFTFAISTTTASISAGTCYLYDVTDTTELQVNETGGCSGTNTADTGVTSTFYTTGVMLQLAGFSDNWDTSYSADEITVSKNKPRTFVLRGDATGATTGASIGTAMAGDAANLEGTTGMNTNTTSTTMIAYKALHNDFIWSDKNDGAHTISTADWTNGYLVSGLSSTTSTQQTIAY